MTTNNISAINEVIATYFKKHTDQEWIAAKKIMPELIKAGIFQKDEKRGLPLRKVLRALDKDNALSEIPFVHAEREGIDTYWYLVREGATYNPNSSDTVISKKQQGILNTEHSDKFYVLNMCDKLLKQTSSRQHRFKFLVGDVHKDGKTRTPLPVDAFYQKSSLVIDFFEKQEDSKSSGLNKKTISGVSRAEQLALYKQRKRDVLSEKNIKFIEIDYAQFECTKEGKLLRKKINDGKVLKEILKKFL